MFYRRSTSSPKKNLDASSICAGDGCYYIDRLLCDHLNPVGVSSTAGSSSDGLTGESQSSSSSSPTKSKQERFVF